MNLKDFIYKAVVFGLVIVSIALFFAGIYFDEEYFLKYSDDAKLELDTIKKIQNFQVLLLSISVTGLLLVLLSIYTKENIKNFIKKNKKTAQNIFLLLIVLLIIFLIGEIFLRIIFYDKTTAQFGPNTLKFNAKYAKLNNENFRDDDFFIKKNTATTRIAVIGDSFTFGWGVKNASDIYTEVLEKKLNDEFDKNYEVYNFGRAGLNTEKELEVLKENVLKFNPDILIIGFIPNDIKNIDKKIPEPKQYTINIPFSFWLRNSIYSFRYIEIKLNQLPYSLGLREDRTTHLLKIISSEINLNYNNKIYQEISDISQENNMPVIIIIFPLIHDLENYPFSPIHDLVKDIGKKYDFYVIDLLPLYKNYERLKLVVNRYDEHPNALAHTLAADEIFKLLKEKNLVD